MSKDNVFVDTKQINKLSIALRGLGKEMPDAAVSAINRTVDHINTQIGKIVTQEYAIKAKDVKSTIKKNKASRGNLSACLISKGPTLSIAHFPFTPKNTKAKRQVKVQIKRQGGKKPINTIPGAFVASTGATDESKTQYNVFKRVGKSRLPIKVIRTLSVPQMIGNADVETKIQETAQKKLSERIQHEIEWRLDKVSKNIKG